MIDSGFSEKDMFQFLDGVSISNDDMLFADGYDSIFGFERKRSKSTGSIWEKLETTTPKRTNDCEYLNLFVDENLAFDKLKGYESSSEPTCGKLEKDSGPAGVLKFENHEGLYPIKFENVFLKQYWRNDRKNLQCFPYCPEHGDYYFVKMQGLKHRKTGGTCSATIYCSFSTGVHSLTDICVVGHIIKEDARFVKKSLMLTEYHELRESCIVGLVRLTDKLSGTFSIEIKSSVWKFNGQLNKTRNGSKNANENKYLFEVLVFKKTETSYELVAQGESIKFNIGSTRTLHRLAKAKEVESGGAHSIVGSAASTVISPRPYSVLDADLFSSNFNRKRSAFEEVALDTDELVLERKKLKLENPQFASKEPDLESGAAVDEKVISKDLNTKASPPKAPPAPDMRSVPRAIIVEPSTRHMTDRARELDNFDSLSLSESWLWALFLGIFGAHYLYLDKPRLACLYALTLGCFFIGYIRDIFCMPFIFARVRADIVFKQKSIQPFHETSLVEAYVVAALFGVFGGHRYFLGYYKTGLLYTFTLGFLGVGLLVDFFFMDMLVNRRNESKKNEYISKNGEEEFLEAQKVSQFFHSEWW